MALHYPLAGQISILTPNRYERSTINYRAATPYYFIPGRGPIR